MSRHRCLLQWSEDVAACQRRRHSLCPPKGLDSAIRHAPQHSLSPSEVRVSAAQGSAALLLAPPLPLLDVPPASPGFAPLHSLAPSEVRVSAAQGSAAVLALPIRPAQPPGNDGLRCSSPAGDMQS